jgi:hypothetical protein
VGKIYNVELNDLYPSENIIGVVKSNGGEERCVLGFGGKA